MRPALLALLALTLACPALAQEPEKKPEPDLELLNAALALHGKAAKETDAAAAKKLWQEAVATCEKLAKDHPGSTYLGMARFNAGYFLVKCLGSNADGIRMFRKLIDDPRTDDKDPTGNLMAPYRNYRHKSWQWIADAEEALGRYERVIAASFASRDAFVTHCGTCGTSMTASFRSRLVSACTKLLLEGEGKVAQKADRERLTAEVHAALEPGKAEAVGAAQFMLRLARAQQKAGRTIDARKLAKLLIRGFARRPEAAAAHKLLEAIAESGD